MASSTNRIRNQKEVLVQDSSAAQTDDKISNWMAGAQQWTPPDESPQHKRPHRKENKYAHLPGNTAASMFRSLPNHSQPSSPLPNLSEAQFRSMDYSAQLSRNVIRMNSDRNLNLTTFDAAGNQEGAASSLFGSSASRADTTGEYRSARNSGANW
eukprot:CAMPEP_0173128062 /NCGR_PEP_ID=MMETSP1102-20130122/58249_1 /TAXON_ID=49646 /ORGANISM="Geminigera sp., Strain Caron Lab Isolate" /LENGTH=154 /DNA_ID=CAMNT_0014037971 /DNA_START=153 /DNA_END=614 /DNA_ORIENTATION=-